MIKNKRGFEFSFSWFFTILVGAIILFLAIYSATKLIDVGRGTQEAVGAKQIGIILSPIETSLEDSKTATISMTTETKIHNFCRPIGAFGYQDIALSFKSGVGTEAWRPVEGTKSSFHNKYLFSSSTVPDIQDTGSKEFYVLAKPFRFPFKIADILILWSKEDKYCFVNSPLEIEEELESIPELNNIELSPSVSSCADVSSKTVCFGTGGCDVDVKFGTINSVYKKADSSTVYFAEGTAPYGSSDKYALLYAAILSDKEIYECQVRRLMGRAATLSSLYLLKSNYLSATPPPQGCGSSTLQPDLSNYQNLALSIKDSSSNDVSIQLKNPNGIIKTVKNLEGKSAQLLCKLF